MKRTIFVMIILTIIAAITVLFAMGVFTTGTVLEKDSKMPMLCTYMRNGVNLRRTQDTFPEPLAGDEFRYNGYIYVCKHIDNSDSLCWIAKEERGNILILFTNKLTLINGISVYKDTIS